LWPLSMACEERLTPGLTKFGLMAKQRAWNAVDYLCRIRTTPSGSLVFVRAEPEAQRSRPRNGPTGSPGAANRT
jgi:hypothetical protein